MWDIYRVGRRRLAAARGSSNNNDELFPKGKIKGSGQPAPKVAGPLRKKQKTAPITCSKYKARRMHRLPAPVAHPRHPHRMCPATKRVSLRRKRESCPTNLRKPAGCTHTYIRRPGDGRCRRRGRYISLLLSSPLAPLRLFGDGAPSSREGKEGLGALLFLLTTRYRPSPNKVRQTHPAGPPPPLPIPTQPNPAIDSIAHSLHRYRLLPTYIPGECLRLVRRPPACLPPRRPPRRDPAWPS